MASPAPPRPLALPVPSDAPAVAQPGAVLAAVCLAALAMPLSFTGPAVALPLLRDAFGASPLALHWVTNAFMLTFGALLMAAGAWADTVGRRRVFLGGLGLAVLDCIGLALAPNIVVFNLLRGLQGAAGAAAFASGMAALAQIFQGDRRVRAFSFVGTAFGAGLAFGPLFAGGLGQALGWRAVMLLPAAFSLAAALLGLRVVPESRNPQATGLDLPGTLSFTLALGLLTVGVLQLPQSGLASAWVLGPWIGALLAGAVFVRVELQAPRQGRTPMLELRLFRHPRFVGVQLLAAAPAYAFVVLLVLLPIRFIGLEGRGPLVTGELMFLLCGPVLVMPALAAWWAQRASAAAISAIGLLLCALGLLWLGQSHPASTLPALAGPLLLIGVGIGLPWGLMDGLAVSVVPPERAGMAAGLFNTVRVAGEGIALAVVGAGLVALMRVQLAHAPGLYGSADAVQAAAQRLGAGDLSQAMPLLPGLDPAAVAQACAKAFAALLRVLAAVTLGTAGVVFAFLRAPHPAAAPALSAGPR